MVHTVLRGEERKLYCIVYVQSYTLRLFMNDACRERDMFNNFVFLN